MRDVVTAPRQIEKPKRLIYLSPLPYDSFSQRPHQFIEWFHRRTGGEVIWIDPYPTRLPHLSDLRRPRNDRKLGNGERSWLSVQRIRAMPIEPLKGLSRLNELFWRKALSRIASVVNEEPTVLVIGKPSAFANHVLNRFPDLMSVYDMMDNFPAFYSGPSRSSIERHERRVIRATDVVVCSSNNLLERALSFRGDPHLISNALAPSSSFVSPRLAPLTSERPRVLGYVGTIASWFDWEFLIELALSRPRDIVRIIGPMFSRAPSSLPANVEILPPVAHSAAIKAMRDFDISLIPFKDNDLTWGVDPLKYYEYRALGLPIISTPFGEMSRRRSVGGVYVVENDSAIYSAVEEALNYKMAEQERRSFLEANSWSSRFNDSILNEFLF